MACKSTTFCSGVEARYRTGTANTSRSTGRIVVCNRPRLGGPVARRIAAEPTGRATRDSLAGRPVWRSVMGGKPHKGTSYVMQTTANSSEPTAKTGGRRRSEAVSRRVDTRRGELLTTTQAAAALGVHERTVRRYLSSGVLACRRLPGGHYRIPAEALAEFWHVNDPSERRRRHRRTGGAPDSRRADRDRRAVSRTSRGRVLLGDDASPDYDLSTSALRALRARFS